MKRGLLMQSMPNSGSTWFAKTLSEHIVDCRYYDKEFFNPICNLQDEEVLRQFFGSELACCYRNIGCAGRDGIDEAIEQTWGRTEYTFNKECQSAFKTHIFDHHFDVFAFLRLEEDTFPPGRLRVWSFYEHAYFALAYHGRLKSEHDRTVDRAKVAFRIQQQAIVRDCARLKIPVIWWHELFGTEAEVRDVLARVPATLKDSATQAIVSARKVRA
jgi:hypothetical protein